MVWIGTVIFLILISLVGFILEKKVGLLCLYGLIWAMVVFICGLKLYGLYSFSEEVYKIVFIGSLFIALGYIIAYKVKFSSKEKKIKKRLQLNQNIIILLLLFSLIFYIIQFIKVFKLMRSGIPLSTIRYSYYTQGKIMNEFETILSSWITTPIVYYLIIPINVWNLINNNGKKKYTILLLSLLDIVLFLFVSQAKQNLIYYMISLVLSLNQFDLNKRQKKNIYKIFIIIFSFIFILNGIRSGNFNFSFIYTYIGTSMSLLGNWVSFIQKNGLYGNGMAFLYGIINIPLSFFNLFHIGNFSCFQEVGTNLTYMISKGIEVFNGVGPKNNVYVTNFMFFYYDARYFSIFLESLIYGMFIGNFTKKLKYNNQSIYMKICYNILGVGFLYTIISWPFFNTAYCLSFLILRLCCLNFKKEKR